MESHALAEALDHLKALPFPPEPDDPDIADWIVDLLEVDGHYAGLATTALAGGRIVPPDPGDLAELRGRLDALRAGTPADEAILSGCHGYLTALERVHACLGP
jgi:hypothetical protein